MDISAIKKSALRTLSLEAASLHGLAAYVDDSFVAALHAIERGTGRLVISGIGKSAIIAQKMVATFNSTGTAAIFMHAADAIHGDLGMVQEGDVVIIISKSGDSPEIKFLVPLIRNFGNTIIGMAGNSNGFLAQHCDILVNTSVEQEACPNNLAPTTSTIAQMAMGDAMAVCLMEMKGFDSGDFAKFHPGGTLGKKLYLRVADLSAQNEKPAVTPHTPLKDVIVEITHKRLGAAAVLNESGGMLGIITDGDLRRMLEKNQPIATVTAADIMTTGAKTVEADALAVDALDLLRRNNISQLAVLENGTYAGMIHIHDLLREGLL